MGLALNAVVKRWPASGVAPVSKLPAWLLPVIAAAVFAWLAATIDDPVQLIATAAGVGVLLLLAALDLVYRLVPNVIVFPAVLGAVLLGPAPSPLSSVIGALAGLAFFGGLYWLGRKLYGTAALGMGDVKLAMLLGALLGAVGVWYALLLGMVLAGLTAAGLLLGKQVDRRSTIPYGSFMALAGLVVIVVSAQGL